MLTRSPRLASPAVWLPVLLLPPVLVADGALRGGGPDVDGLRALLVVVGCLPLLLRRLLPFPATCVVLTAGIVLALFAVEPANTVVLIPIVALVDFALAGDRRRSVWAAVGVVPCVAVSVALFADDLTQYFTIVGRNLVFCFIALGVGDVIRSRRETAEAEAERRLGEQRLELAREVHDVVAHAMVAINVRAGVAAHLVERDPDQAHAALREIKQTSGEALTELRAALGVLRGDGEASVAPARGLSDLDELAAGLRAAGVHVELEVGELPRLPASVHAAGHRIVQEALTNVLRHAGASSVSVAVAADGDEAVSIEVVDDGSARPGATPGNGTRGMSERAQALRGSLESGPLATGGWRVGARLPIGHA